jgi:hypothetical protein
MPAVTQRLLDRGFSVEVDSVDQPQWDAITREFQDKNILQTWSYGVARGRRRNLSHLLLKRAGHVVAATQVRMAGLPRLRLGLAYVRWGPLWRRRGGEEDPEVFRQMIRAMRNEYSIRRGLAIRLLPSLCAEQNAPYADILETEGFQLAQGGHQYRTILMDVRAPLEALERGLHQKWRKHLNRARKNGLEIVEGEEDGQLQALGAIYEEMAKRKNLSAGSDIEVYRAAQRNLPVGERMRVILCRAEGQVVAGALFSALGDTAVDLFRATSDLGVKSYGSYLVQWKVVEHAKQKGCHWYNLNSVNPLTNPGGYQFKSQLGGKHGSDVFFLGPYDSHPNAVTRMLLSAAEKWQASRKRQRERAPEASVQRPGEAQAEQVSLVEPGETGNSNSIVPISKADVAQ